MQIHFTKMNGAGNDFVVLDNRELWFDWDNKELIAKLCSRRTGVGADGILLLQNHLDHDFEMLYANSDGSKGAMCGNGGRCIVRFAHELAIAPTRSEYSFLAPDGPHTGQVLDDNLVRISIGDTTAKSKSHGLDFIDTGTEHHVQHVVNLDDFPVVSEARKVRAVVQDPRGVNVNYVEKIGDTYHVRTYERGVEDETLACGTGATAVALCTAPQAPGDYTTKVQMPGGLL